MPKTLLNVSQSTGTKPSVSLNTTQIVSTKHSTGFCKPKASLNVPSTTKSLLVKPPIGSSLLSKKKSMQVNNNMDVSRSQRSAPGHHNQQSSNMGTQRTKSIERTSLALSQGKSKALQSQKVSKQTVSIKSRNPCLYQFDCIDYHIINVLYRNLHLRPREAEAITTRSSRQQQRAPIIAILSEVSRISQLTYWNKRIRYLLQLRTMTL